MAMVLSLALDNIASTVSAVILRFYYIAVSPVRLRRGGAFNLYLDTLALIGINMDDDRDMCSDLSVHVAVSFGVLEVSSRFNPRPASLPSWHFVNPAANTLRATSAVLQLCNWRIPRCLENFSTAEPTFSESCFFFLHLCLEFSCRIFYFYYGIRS